MDKCFQKTKLESIDLNDCESVAYFYSNNELSFKIVNWQNKIIEVNFYGVILFVDWGGVNYVSKLYLNTAKTDFLRKALTNFYGCEEVYIPADQPYKLFQFVDSFGDACFEIVCKEFEFKVKG